MRNFRLFSAILKILNDGRLSRILLKEDLDTVPWAGSESDAQRAQDAYCWGFQAWIIPDDGERTGQWEGIHWDKCAWVTRTSWSSSGEKWSDAELLPRDEGPTSHWLWRRNCQRTAKRAGTNAYDSVPPATPEERGPLEDFIMADFGAYWISGPGRADRLRPFAF